MRNRIKSIFLKLDVKDHEYEFKQITKNKIKPMPGRNNNNTHFLENKPITNNLIFEPKYLNILIK